MQVEQIYTGCLAHGAYYIESNGEAAIVDPLREVQPYIDLAEKRGAKIKYIFETHFHADFVSGHVTLSEKTGAPIIYGPTAKPGFDAIVATDNQEFKLGDVTVRVLHTPGHTMESSTFLLLDEEGKEHSAFTGDTLFLGDVGRPDLAQKAADMTQEELAGVLYDSIRSKVMTLSDDVIVYPGHGAGSACGKNMSRETVGTIGEQKQSNYALRADMTRDEFIAEVIDGLMPPPGYFPLNAKMNKEGYVSIDEVMDRGTKALTPELFETVVNETGAVMLDCRTEQEFSECHVPRSTFIGLNGDFAPWVGALIVDVKQPIVLILDEDHLEEAITRLSRVGFDQIFGYLKGGLDAWKADGREVDSIKGINAETLAAKASAGTDFIVDVRKQSEFAEAHVRNAENIPLVSLNEHLASLPSDRPFYIHCEGGYRSVIANSMLKAKGIHNGIDVRGGFEAIKETDAPVEVGVNPSAEI